jgi:mono/diheme cytochrome c family protein
MFGMSSWTSDPEVFGKRFDPETHTSDYTIDTKPHEPGGPYELPTPLAAAGPGVGPAPPPVPAPAAEIAATQAEATNCISCHTDDETLRALAVEEEEEKTSEESSGEG